MLARWTSRSGGRHPRGGRLREGIVENLGFERILQVKIPVTDLQRSVNWYRRVFGLRLAWESDEPDVVSLGVPSVDAL